MVGVWGLELRLSDTGSILFAKQAVVLAFDYLVTLADVS